MSIDEIRDEALRLSPEGRAHLARELISSLESLSDDELERLWLEEAVRRDEEFDRGVAEASPAEEVLARARARRG